MPCSAHNRLHMKTGRSTTVGADVDASVRAKAIGCFHTLLRFAMDDVHTYCEHNQLDDADVSMIRTGLMMQMVGDGCVGDQIEKIMCAETTGNEQLMSDVPDDLCAIVSIHVKQAFHIMTQGHDSKSTSIDEHLLRIIDETIASYKEESADECESDEDEKDEEYEEDDSHTATSEISGMCTCASCIAWRSCDVLFYQKCAQGDSHLIQLMKPMIENLLS